MRFTETEYPLFVSVTALQLREEPTPIEWTTPPQTLADAWAVVSVLCDREDEVIVGESLALDLLRDFLATLVDKGLRTAEAPALVSVLPT